MSVIEASNNISEICQISWQEKTKESMIRRASITKYKTKVIVERYM